MTKQKPKVPPTKIPIIGSADKAKSEEFVRQIMQYLDPIMNNILQSIDGIERRLAIVEEVKQVFPQTVNVIIKKESGGKTSSLPPEDFKTGKELEEKK